MKLLRQYLLGITFSVTNLPCFLTVAIISRILKSAKEQKSYNVFWGTEPILNNYHWSQATKANFTQSTYITRRDSFILNGRADTVLFSDRCGASLGVKIIIVLRENLIFALTFMKILLRGNLVCISCDGFIFQNYKTFGFDYRLELMLLKLAGVAVCVLPYGSDAYVYSKVQDKNWLYGLLSDYPDAARRQKQIEKRVDFYARHSDLFLPGPMLFDGLGRSDWITPSILCVEKPKEVRKERSRSGTLIVTHAPNHREVKGTKFVIGAVNQLIDEGIAIELRLLENKPNHEVIRVLTEESDVHIDQLFFDGYALNALEARRVGVPSIGNFSGPLREFFDRWSFTAECPMIVANDRTLPDVLRSLCNDREYLETVSMKSVDYVKKFHSNRSFAENFSRLLEKTDPMYVQWLELSGR